MEKSTTVQEMLKPVHIMLETMYLYTYQKVTGIQHMSKDCHLLLAAKVVENSLVISC